MRWYTVACEIKLNWNWSLNNLQFGNNKWLLHQYTFHWLSISTADMWGGTITIYFIFPFYRKQWCTKHLMFHQQCHCSSCLLCCVIHYCSTGWCCGTLLYCEEEMWLPEVLLSDNSSQAAAATASTSVWWHCGAVSEHWTEGECCIWPCAPVKITCDYELFVLATHNFFFITGHISGLYKL